MTRRQRENRYFLSYNEYIDYEESQIEKVAYLLKELVKKYDIKPYRILGHSDVAPYRKIDGSDEIKDEIESEKVWESSAAIDFKSSDWNGVFMSEKFAAAKAFVDITPCRDVFNGFELKIKIQQPILDKLRIVQSASCFYEFDAPIVFYTGGRSASVSLFPTEFSSDSMAGLSLGLSGN